ncbi:unnamed protein product [Diamesa hyperborea]
MVEGIQKFYNDKTIFITGASGFMGKVLLEKLLYSCSDIKEVFILMRPKRGKSGAERVEEMTKLPLFQRLRDEKPHILKKIVPVFGDITSKRLGLNDEQFKQLTSSTQVTFHMAATLKLEATLKPAVEMNLQGTQNVIDVCKSMTKLLVLVHLSTAFCNCDQDVLFEEVYDWPHNPKDLMRCAEWMTEETMDVMGNRMMAPHPNTYTYTKRLAEILVRDEFPNLPLCIVRPSIVTPAYQEPLPGWVDSLNGPIGIMVAGGKGVIRSMLCEAEFEAEVIPVDFAINSLIGIAYSVATMEEKPEKIPVFNIVCDEKSRITWGTVLNEGKRINWDHPFEAGLWYPNGDITMNPVKHYVTTALTQWLPALLIDFLMLIFFQRRFMIRIQKRIFIGLFVLQYFTTRRWSFSSDNFKAVFNKLTPEEQQIFYMNTVDIDILSYLKNIILGGRVYCLKEPLSTMKKARIQLRFQRALDLGLKAFLMYLFVKMIITWSGYNQSLFAKQ